MTSQVTILSWTNTTDEVYVCQGMIYIGDGTDDLDGTGGEFELTMILDGQTVQPDPQLVWFSTALRACIFTEQFPLYVGGTVTFKIKSPNAADTSVYVHACIVEVGVESIRDDLQAVLLNQRSVKNVYDESGGGSGGGSTGVYPESGSGSGAGVYAGKC